MFDSVALGDSVMNFTMISELNARYPNQFLDGRYRQEVVFYKNKFYTFGGGKEKNQFNRNKNSQTLKEPFLIHFKKLNLPMNTG